MKPLCWGLGDKGGDNTWQIESDTSGRAVIESLGSTLIFHNPPPWPPSHPERENTGFASTPPLLTKGHRVKVEPRMSFVFASCLTS